MRNVVSKFVGRGKKEFNPTLLRLAAYYGFHVNVTNCYDGNKKGTVESAVRAVRNAAFASHWQFDDAAAAQAHLGSVLAEMNPGRRPQRHRRRLHRQAGRRSNEADRRRGKERGVSAGAEAIKEQFADGHLSPEARQKVRVLETLAFLDDRSNVVMMGNPDVGKTALSVAIGTKACENDRTVVLVNVPNLVVEMKEAMGFNQLTAHKKAF